MERESFILYTSFYEPLKYLSDSQMGKLFRAIFEYQLNGRTDVDNEIRIAFEFIKNQLDIDADKWKDEKQKRSEAGKKGMAKRWNKDKIAITNNNKDNTVINAITKITDNVNVNENVNVNDNEINNALSEDESSSSDTAKASKHKYGEYKHVLLKDEELQALKKDYANWEELIKYLDEYIEMKGYKAKSHYLCIKKWVVDAVKQNNSRAKENKSNRYTEDKNNQYQDLSKFYMNL